MRVIGLVLVVGLALGLALAPLAAGARQAGKVYRVGLIATGPEPIHPSIRAFVHGWRALGYVEGQNLILERRSAEGRFARFGDIVDELVRLRTDVIVAPGEVAPRAAKMVTTTVPIVMATGEDPVGTGLVQSLAHPGGNVAGLMLVVGPEIEGKRLEIFTEALPGVSRVAYLGRKKEKDWEGPWGQSVRTAALICTLSLLLQDAAGAEEAIRASGA